jgi:hypothetical protein
MLEPVLNKKEKDPWEDVKAGDVVKLEYSFNGQTFTIIGYIFYSYGELQLVALNYNDVLLEVSKIKNSVNIKFIKKFVEGDKFTFIQRAKNFYE